MASNISHFCKTILQQYLLHVHDIFSSFEHILYQQCLIISITDEYLTVQAFWRIMFSYRQVKEWHSKSDTRTQPDELGEGTSNPDIAIDRSYVRTKLENGLLRVWRVCLNVQCTCRGISTCIVSYIVFVEIYACVSYALHELLGVSWL